MTSVLVIRTSLRLAKMLKLRLSQGSYVQGVPLLSWNADEMSFEHGGNCAFLSEDATLYSIVVPLRDIRTEDDFIERVVERLQALAADCGQPELFKSVNVIFTKRTDRRRIGSQNDLMNQCRALMEEAQGPFLPAMSPMLEAEANRTPLSVLGMSRPCRELERLKKAGTTA